MEITSKKAVSRKRNVISIPKRITRDPRFDNVSGHKNEFLSRKSYAFLEEYRDSEIKSLKEQIKKEKNPELKSELELQLTRLVKLSISPLFLFFPYFFFQDVNSKFYIYIFFISLHKKQHFKLVINNVKSFVTGKRVKVN